MKRFSATFLLQICGMRIDVFRTNGAWIAQLFGDCERLILYMNHFVFGKGNQRQTNENCIGLSTS